MRRWRLLRLPIFFQIGSPGSDISHPGQETPPRFPYYYTLLASWSAAHLAASALMPTNMPYTKASWRVIAKASWMVLSLVRTPSFSIPCTNGSFLVQRCYLCLTTGQTLPPFPLTRADHFGIMQQRVSNETRSCRYSHRDKKDCG